MHRTIRLLVMVCLTLGMAGVAALPARASSAPASLSWSQGGSTITSSDFGTLTAGQTASRTFTLTNTGGSSSGMLAVTLSGASAFTITSDTCTGLALGPRKSCTVTVQYAPTTSGESDSATLTATGEHASASLKLTGKSSGTADLYLSPGQRSADGANGAKNYSYGPAQGAPAGSWTQSFTVTNNGTAASEMLTLAGCCDSNFTLSNNTCSGVSLAPNGGSCTFDLTFTSPGCTSFQLFNTPLDVNGQPTGYIHLGATGIC